MVRVSTNHFFFYAILSVIGRDINHGPKFIKKIDYRYKEVSTSLTGQIDILSNFHHLLSNIFTGKQPNKCRRKILKSFNQVFLIF